ncbi:MAG: hypothetical protein KAS13_01075 [Candidatus Omnitrophica bacterium]|nr:hypothetical protein [Candidatus Omnitrophota bacterium]
MRLKKSGFTLLELQMASILMTVVLIATGVIFYFSLASIRYIHDAAMVYSNANTAMQTLTREIMVSNCWGNAQGVGFATPQYSFYGLDGYYPGIEQDVIGGSTAAMNSVAWMPVYGAITAAEQLFLRQPPQQGSIGGNPDTVAGDFSNHDALAIFRLDNADGIGELHVSVAQGGGFPDITAGDYIAAHHITNFDFQPISYNCVAVRITATGTVPDPIGASLSGQFFEVTLGKMITLRCAPTKKPWLNVGEL